MELPPRIRASAEVCIGGSGDLCVVMEISGVFRSDEVCVVSGALRSDEVCGDCRSDGVCVIIRVSAWTRRRLI